jgi:hypothetical protein
MENLLNHIHIFKTNIGKENLREVRKIFSRNKFIQQWNVDTEDCDRVLRIVSEQLSESEIRTMVCHYGFECADLQ